METETYLAVNYAIIGVIIGLIVWLTVRHGRRSGQGARVQTAVTVLGIFGTFLGIYLGLMNFDPGDIRRSVPELLAGLKTAFITSVAGMGAALYLKLGEIRHPRSEPGGLRETLGALNATLMRFERQIQPLHEGLKAVNESDRRYEERLARLDEEIRKSLLAAEEHIRRLPDALKETMSRLAAELEEALNDFEERLEMVPDAIKAAGQQQIAILEEHQKQVASLLERFTRQSAKLVDDQILRLDQALEQELTNSLRALGDHLAALSGKFVEDYTPLTERLREIVRIAEDRRLAPPDDVIAAGSGVDRGRKDGQETTP
jgi:biopolymer transport protein ExbB/TolQ